MRRQLLATVVLLVVVNLTGHGQTGQGRGEEAKSLNLTAYAELLRSDVRAQKVAILTEVMGFTEAEDAKFWPIYREYDGEMAKLGDQRMALITDYANEYATLTDAAADRLASRALALEAQRQALRGKCYEKVKAALSPRTAMRFLQVEHQLQLLIDLQIAAALPVAPADTKAKADTRR